MIKEYVIPEMDLLWVEIEAYLNAYALKRGAPQRIRCDMVNEYVMKITLRDYVLAMYLKDTSELMRCGSCSDLHWAAICHVFQKLYTNLTILK